MAYLNMDLSDTPSGMGFDPIPAGEYPAQIVGTDLTRSQNDDLMLNLTWQVMEGDHAERLVFDRVMLSGSDKSVAFGKRKIKTIADAIGHPNPNRVEDTEELHGRPCLIVVAIKPYNGEDRNEVRNYKPITKADPAPAAAAAPSASAAQGKTTPPPPSRKSQVQTPFDPPAGEAGGEPC